MIGDARISLDGRTGEHERGLSPREREIIKLICEEGLSYQEIAERFGTSVATVKVQVSRARALLGIAGESMVKFVVTYWKKRMADAARGDSAS